MTFQMQKARPIKMAKLNVEDLSQEDFEKRATLVTDRLINTAADAMEEHGVEVVMLALANAHGGLIGSLSNGEGFLFDNVDRQLETTKFVAEKAYAKRAEHSEG